MKKQNRNKERIYLLVVSVIIGLLFYKYYSNISSYVLEDATTAYQEKRAINLTQGFNQEDFKQILKSGDYFSDATYEDFVAKRVSDTLSKYGRMANLGQLNKRPFLVEAEDVKRNGGKWGQFRYLVSATKLGLDSLLLTEIDTKYAQLPATLNVSKTVSNISISGIVKSSKKQGNKPLSNVLVRLQEKISSQQKETLINQYLDSAKHEDLVDVDLDKLIQEPSFYVRTDASGAYTFTNLEKGKNYAVIPIGKGKEYGVLRGQAQIQESHTYNFTEKTHTLSLFDTQSYSRIKADKVFTVRTPAEFTKILWRSLIIFLLGFWLLHIAMSLKNRDYDQTILPVLMAIIGVGIVVLFAIQEPLRDTEFASSAAVWCLGVLVAFSAITLFFKKEWIKNMVQFNYLNNKYFPKPNFVKKSIAKDSRGFAWLLLSFVVMLALVLFGSGPEGSGVKVNLGPIQVSEIAKFIMVIFFAKYFTANLNNFRYIPNNRWLVKHSLVMLLGFGLLIGIYAVTGDLGPALVLCITFMIFYALAKNEFVQMVGAGIVFVGLLVAINYFFPESKFALLGFSVFAIIGLLIFAFIQKKNESMLFLVSIISSFILIENLPFSFAERLKDRNSMYKDIWANSLHGGDQVAQGIWSIDSGGLFGQGLGYGFSNVMPAYHTDMIFESIGEELGIITMIVLLLLFGVLFFRSMLVARRTGNTLLFYLVNGIAIATLVQLSIIVAGSLGLIPLTGITVPFLSMGKSSLLVNLFFFLLIIVISQYKGKEYQMKEIEEKFDNLNISVLMTFMGVILIFTVALFKYCYTADTDMIKPVKVLSKKGAWMLSENPRIKIFANKLTPGDIYDRNGVLLATSDRETFLDAEKSVFGAYADKQGYNKQKNSRLKRYYPFSEDLLFWLGDWNNQLVTYEGSGYVADYRLLSTLRGFENKKADIKVAESYNFQESPYLPKEDKTSKLVFRNYEDFVPYMKAGINSKMIEEFNAKDRNIKISLDAKMNQMINQVIRDEQSNFKDFKISVVGLNAATGEVLASTMNPKPDYEMIKKLNAIPKQYYQKLFNAYFGYNHFVADRDFAMFETSSPGSTIKVVDALAYLKRDGADSANVSYHITPSEIVDLRHGEPTGKVDLTRAIDGSSNVYFIRLLNEKKFEKDLFDLYHSVGIHLGKTVKQQDRRLYEKIGGYYLNREPNYDEMDITNQWNSIVNSDRGIHYNDEKYFGTRKRYLQSELSFMAWGQGPVEATPLQLARLYGSIAQGGQLAELNILKEAAEAKQNTKYNQLIKNEGNVNNIQVTNVIENAMKLQSKTVSQNTGVIHYGKTGSPERNQRYYNSKQKKSKIKRTTDAWYIAYIKDTKTGQPYVFATRIMGIGNSKSAKDLWVKIANKLKAEYFTKQQNN